MWVFAYTLMTNYQNHCPLIISVEVHNEKRWPQSVVRYLGLGATALETSIDFLVQNKFVVDLSLRKKQNTQMY